LTKSIAVKEIDVMSIALAKGYKIQMLENLHLVVAVGEGQNLE